MTKLILIEVPRNGKTSVILVFDSIIGFKNFGINIHNHLSEILETIHTPIHHSLVSKYSLSGNLAHF